MVHDDASDDQGYSLMQAIARSPSFVALLVASFVDKGSDKARDKGVMQTHLLSNVHINMHAFLYHLPSQDSKTGRLGEPDDA